MEVVLFFSISGGELIIVLLFVLLFFGSKGIPDIARTLGRTMRQMRDASQDVQREIHRGAQEVRRSVEEQRRSIEREEGSSEPASDAPGKPPEKPTN